METFKMVAELVMLGIIVIFAYWLIRVKNAQIALLKEKAESLKEKVESSQELRARVDIIEESVKAKYAERLKKQEERMVEEIRKAQEFAIDRAVIKTIVGMLEEVVAAGKNMAEGGVPAEGIVDAFKKILESAEQREKESANRRLRQGQDSTTIDHS